MFLNPNSAKIFLLKLTFTVATTTSLLSPSLAIAQQATQPQPLRQIVVDAIGIAKTQPDMATLRLGVVNRAASVQQALETNNETMTRLFKKLSEDGIEKSDIQTFNLSVDTVLPSENNQKIDHVQKVEYQAANNVSVRIRDLANLAKVYDGAVAAGVNDSNGLEFSNANPALYQAAARKNAVFEAAAKARTIADAANLKLGPILSIVEADGGATPRLLHAGLVGRSMNNTPVANGELTYQVNITVTYAIE